MTKIFVVMGISKDPIRVWPVYWAFEREACAEVTKTCKAEAAQLKAELEPVWSRFEQITQANIARKLVEDQEREIHKRFAASMFDPLFPLGTVVGDDFPEVDYVVWAIGESMRDDFSPQELLKMRAALHAAEYDDAFPLDES